MLQALQKDSESIAFSTASWIIAERRFHVNYFTSEVAPSTIPSKKSMYIEFSSGFPLDSQHNGCGAVLIHFPGLRGGPMRVPLGSLAHLRQLLQKFPPNSSVDEAVGESSERSSKISAEPFN